MGLQSELGYRQAMANALQRFLTKVTGTRVGAWITYHVAAPTDRAVKRLSGGDRTFTQWFAGVPPIWVTTAGAKSGLPRTTPLFGIPIGDDLALVGTGVGQAPTPAWVHNLRADASATVEYQGARCEVVARVATADEEQDVWSRAETIYAGFREYRRRLTRPVSIFVLEPVPSER